MCYTVKPNNNSLPLCSKFYMRTYRDILIADSVINVIIPDLSIKGNSKLQSSINDIVSCTRSSKYSSMLYASSLAHSGLYFSIDTQI